MIKLKSFTDLGLKITWKLINIGFKGSEQFHDELGVEDILNYAILKIEELNCDDVIELACQSKKNVYEIDNIIKRLSKNESSNIHFEYRKWRAVYILTHLKFNKKNFIDGLVELGDIWAKFDFPKDSPHVFQGRYNSITPEEYYTEENYKNLYRKHLNWIICEIKSIKKLE